MSMISTTRPPRLLLVILAAVITLSVLAPGCGGDQSATDAASALAPPSFARAVVAPSPSVASSAPSVATTAKAVPSPSSPAAVGSGGSAWQATGDELSAAGMVIKRFVAAIDAQDLSAAGDVMASDAGFQLEGITNEVMGMDLQKSLHVAPDERGVPHLAMVTRGVVDVVPVAGAGLASGPHEFTAEVRRDSRRDEWRIWDFRLR